MDKSRELSLKSKTNFSSYLGIEQNMEERHFSSSAEETMALGYSLGKRLPSRSVVCFFGELAAGKTTFIKGLVSGFAGIAPEAVQSPTFTYLNIYQGSKDIYHFDLYRLKQAEEFFTMGFEDYLDQEGVCCIEWSEKIEPYLPSHCTYVVLTHAGEEKREIKIIQHHIYS